MEVLLAEEAQSAQQKSATKRAKQRSKKQAR